MATSKIEAAAAEAVKVIANAAQEATKTIANAATEAAKITSITTNTDHDTLIAFRAETISELGNVRSDIKKLTDGTTTQIADHETRLNALETSKTAQSVMLSIGIGIQALLVSILVYHLTR